MDNHPPKEGNGAECTEPTEQSRPCNEDDCPGCSTVVDGIIVTYNMFTTINETDCEYW